MSESTVVTKELEQVAMTWPAKARGVVITDQHSYDAAAEMVIGIKRLRKEVADSYDPVIQSAYKAHRAAVAAKKKIDGPLEEAEAILKGGLTKWNQAQERLRLEAERRAREEQWRMEQELRLARATELADLGAPEEVVSDILDTRVEMPAPIAAPTFTKAEGVSSRETWRAEVFDVVALCKAIAEGKVPANLIEPNMPALNGMARALKEALNIPGVKAIKDSVVQVRTD
jgi:hypothetical protein